MKYKVVVLFFVIFGITTALSKDKFSDIYSKNMNARGGAELVQSLKTFIYGGELIRGDSLHFHFRIAYKVPNKMIVEYYHDGDTIAVGYDGVKAWTLMPKLTLGIMELPKSSIDEATTLTIAPILNYLNRLDLYTNDKSNIKISDTEFNDTIPYYTLTCKNKDDNEETITVNQTDWLVSSVKTTINVSGKFLPAFVRIDNYQKIDSAMIPFHVKITSGNTSILELKLSYMELNPELEDIIFEMPK